MTDTTTARPLCMTGDLSGGLFISPAALWTLSFFDLFFWTLSFFQPFWDLFIFQPILDFVVFGITRHHHHQAPVYHGGTFGWAFYLPDSFLDFVIFFFYFSRN